MNNPTHTHEGQSMPVPPNQNGSVQEVASNGDVTSLADGRKRLVILESPFAGDIELNVRYARAALRDCLLRGESPLASHLLFTQPGVLDDLNTVERRLGIEAGLAWGIHAHATVVYRDLGVSPGMKLGIARAVIEGRPVEYRSLHDWADLPVEKQLSGVG